MNVRNTQLMKFVFNYIKPRIKLFIISFLFLIGLSLISLLPPYVTKLAFDEGIMMKNLSILRKYVLILVVIYILKSTFNYLSSAFFTIVSQNTLLEIKKDLTNHIRNTFGIFQIVKVVTLFQRFGEADSQVHYFLCKVSN